jgi:FAD/FMN-containing dehydrogenase
MSRYETELAVEALRPGDDGYDASADGFFGTGRPDLVIRPRHPDDIAAALALAARRDLAVSVRSGGHGPLGQPSAPGTLMIDLAHFDDVEIFDADRRLVRIGGGATWGKVAATLGSRGLAITAGDTFDVGVGGLTLGGGIGWMVRRYGLAIDNLVGARVVTADGRLLSTSKHEHPDLFWALRGGGGSCGVVVDFDFVAQPVDTVHFATVVFRLDDEADLIARWRDAMRVAPDEVSSTLALTPGMPPRATLLLCYCDGPDTTEADAAAAIDPLLRLGTVTSATIARRAYPDILESALRPPHARLTARNTLVAALDRDVIAAIGHLRAGAPVIVALRSLGGAFGRVPRNATAFAHRDAEAMIVALAMLPENATDRDVDDALEPWSAVAEKGCGTYLNFQSSATAADLTAAYPPATLARLTAVKRAYDPGNRFAVGHTIEEDA